MDARVEYVDLFIEIISRLPLFLEDRGGLIKRDEVVLLLRFR
jgi:hypothetical protein